MFVVRAKVRHAAKMKLFVECVPLHGVQGHHVQRSAS